ncbi:hypothetical protein NPIL_422051 [Nephila pilipes]|uniref:Uncharacterized protein n=1 Tax=Nephila pilipes TaxID=299642 RepID=A0A8X6IG52_NEPPI|nr:hypothetical protein NPIL_422051 [Nephila pilipes]
MGAISNLGVGAVLGAVAGLKGNAGLGANFGFRSDANLGGRLDGHGAHAGHGASILILSRCCLGAVAGLKQCWMGANFGFRSDANLVEGWSHAGLGSQF